MHKRGLYKFAKVVFPPSNPVKYCYFCLDCLYVYIITPKTFTTVRKSNDSTTFSAYPHRQREQLLTAQATRVDKFAATFLSLERHPKTIFFCCVSLTRSNALEFSNRYRCIIGTRRRQNSKPTVYMHRLLAVYRST